MAGPNHVVDWVLAYTEPSEAARQVMVDEIQLHVAPVLLGNGIRLFDTLRTRPVTLETRDVAAGELIDMRLRVVK